ncbi:MAG: sulfur oxidation c-type cytochrome SoxX [Proteobacteria bacterium]|nr:sulfur oxidation c-type cytochrome SoxX [Pseudomonadota bacterium]
MKKIVLTLPLVLSALAAPAFAIDAKRVDQVMQDMFGKAPPPWQERMQLDETERTCTDTRSQPNAAQAKEIEAREAKTVVFPADGNMLGDWKAGYRVANAGTGLQFSDKADAFIGGNCYACHQMDPKELSYGTLGPSLAAYGRDRKGDADAVKSAWIKLYNSNAAVACSMMPRFGHKKVLSEQQLKDVMAYLFDPESPVNK